MTAQDTPVKCWHCGRTTPNTCEKCGVVIPDGDDLCSKCFASWNGATIDELFGNEYQPNNSEKSKD